MSGIANKAKALCHFCGKELFYYLFLQRINDYII